MTGVLIVSYNRPQYFKRCLESFSKAVIPAGTVFMLIDDCSTDPETIRLFQEFQLPGVPIIKNANAVNKKIAANIKHGFENLFQFGCDIVMNFDSDAIIKPNAIEKLIQAKITYSRNIITGFNSKTKNADGSQRHEIVSYDAYVNFKKSVGGINMVLNKSQYDGYVLPALQSGGNWDHKTCIKSYDNGYPIACLYPSVVQHIGYDSSMGHSGEAPDVAEDFFELSLPNVTLIGADTNHFHELEKAARISCADIQFGAVKLLQPEEVKSGRDYNRFCMKEFYKHVETEFALVLQWDGYLLRYRAWEDEFLEYDFCGATWNYKDGRNVGNGGFSLRSRKLMEILGTDDSLTEFMPEDHHICRTYRPYLEKKYGIKYAPAEVADRFSIEAHGHQAFPGSNKYNGQLGFHGWNIDFSGWDLPHTPQKPKAAIQPIQKSRMKAFNYR